MPTPQLEEPIQKVTLNLFTRDVEQFKRRYGQGWTSQVREVVRRNCREFEVYQKKMGGMR